MAEQRWFKGNLHTHTTESDGDADPQQVVEWYKNHGYDFLVLSDHNHRTILDHDNQLGLVMIPGEEVSAHLINSEIVVHINGIGITKVVEAVDAQNVVDTIQSNVNAVISAGGIAQINHPNTQWAIDHEDILQVNGLTLFEVYNGGIGPNNEGGIGKLSTEEMWDKILSSGYKIFGVATDDAHHYSDFNHTLANPGRGWVFVQSENLSSESILNSLSIGKFYFSTGVELCELKFSDNVLSLQIEPIRNYIYSTTLIGKDGIVLSQEDGLDVSYELKGNEGYVRATIRSSYGTKAWTQPVFINS